jgi:hypothetical protein
LADPIPSQDYLGRCYDILRLDPLDLAGSALYENALDVQAATKTVPTRDGTRLIPVWANHKNIFSFDWDSTTGTISSTYEFEQEFRGSVSAEAGVPGTFEFSGSASYKEVMTGTVAQRNLRVCTCISPNTWARCRPKSYGGRHTACHEFQRRCRSVARGRLFVSIR